MSKESITLRLLKSIKVLQERNVYRVFMGRVKPVTERRVNPWNPLSYISILISLIGYIAYHGFGSIGRVRKELRNLFTWS